MPIGVAEDECCHKLAVNKNEYKENRTAFLGIFLC